MRMRIDIITILPRLLEGPFDDSILKRARDKGLVEIIVHNLRDYATGKQKQVDDYAFGGGAGMVMMIEPIDNCLEYLKKDRHYDEVIYLSPDGELFDQPMANMLSTKQNLVLLAGHYKGIDERVRQHLVTKEISVGNYVLTGGELPAAIITDAVVRLIPGVLSDESSALTDSFQDGLVSPPVYTRPASYKEWHTPEVLRSGNEKLINEWRFEQAVERTRKRRPGMLDNDMNG
jgi:tRNA (guanine37-N1)-methyltransferase